MRFGFDLHGVLIAPVVPGVYSAENDSYTWLPTYFQWRALVEYVSKHNSSCPPGEEWSIYIVTGARIEDVPSEFLHADFVTVVAREWRHLVDDHPGAPPDHPFVQSYMRTYREWKPRAIRELHLDFYADDDYRVIQALVGHVPQLCFLPRLSDVPVVRQFERVLRAEGAIP